MTKDSSGQGSVDGPGLQSQNSETLDDKYLTKSQTMTSEAMEKEEVAQS